MMARLPLEDVRILDLCWVLAGPHGTRLLADLGAEVIKIESKAKLDGWRTGLGLFREGVSGPLEEGSGLFQQENRNKIGLCLNLKIPEGREIFERLVKISDVVTSNYSAKGFRKMGLEWDKLRAINPQIIVVSMPGLGNWGPYSDFTTFGPSLQALTGMTGLTGFPGEEPVGVGTSWADYLGGANMALSILGALEYRRRTGEGQFIDISQQEASLSLLGSSLLDWAANHKKRENHGNRHPVAAAAPHNCYKCLGEDRWCVIAVASEEEWGNFCRVLDNPPWTQESRFATLLDRIRNQDELDKLIEDWTINYSPEEVVEKLQSGGVSAGVVQNIEDLLRDTHLWERGFLIDLELPHPERKPPNVVLSGVATPFSGRNLGIRRSAPGSLGEPNEYILKDLLGMTQEEIERAAAKDAFK
jgi:crotonobetainyl-CoA:carnitine CoA-transferase CaiB-like acyl-CoA transferase